MQFAVELTDRSQKKKHDNHGLSRIVMHDIFGIIDSCFFVISKVTSPKHFWRCAYENYKRSIEIVY